MLNFVLGRACTGKSRYITEKAAKSSLERETVIIVPEQFSFETERAVLHTEKFNTDNIQVLSFTKLYSVVAKQAGFGGLPVINDGERLLLSDMALKQSAEQLSAFDRFVKYPDFSVKMADMIRDFKFSAVSAEDLLGAAKSIGGSCGAKLHDIAVVMSVYESLLTDKFIDPSDHLTRLAYILSDFEYFSGKAVYFDSFSGFTGQQFKIIERIISQAQEVTFSFCSDDIDSTEINAFYNINMTAQKIRSIALRCGVSVGDILVLDRNFYSNDTLRSLEAAFAGTEDISARSENGDLRIISCKEPREEAFAAAGLIRSLVRDNGYRFRDFIVVARNADDYKGYMEIFCKKNDIPCFFDKKISLTDTLLYTYVDSLLKLKSSFSTENIFNWLKIGFHSFDAEDIYALEDYIYIWNISGKDWADDWTMSPSGFETGEMSESDRSLLLRLNAIRKNIYTKLSSFVTRPWNTAKDAVSSIYDFIIKEKCDARLSEICAKLEEQGEHFEASVVRQSWDKLMSVFDSVVKLYGTHISADEFAKAFKIACSAVEIANVPQMLDEVTFGSADRIRPSKPRIAIILGANQGVFPRSTAKTGILAVSDKKKLEQYGISLNDDEIKSAVEENYLVYSMLCCPVDKTFILYSTKSASGTALQPSAFVSMITGRLKNISAEIYSPLGCQEFLPQTPESAFYLMSDIYGDDFETLRESLVCRPDMSRLVESFDKSGITDDFQVSAENSDKLFDSSIYISATKFDNFNSCRLMYFLKYGLRTGKLLQADLNVMQRGTITHYVLESLIEKYRKSFCELSERELSIEVDRLIDVYISAVAGSEILLTPRFKYLLSRISESVKEVACHLAEEFRQSDFEPAYCELEISADGQVHEMHIPIEKGEMVLTGKIDRLDVFNNVIRVVDYKTGSKSFELSDTLFGLNMQMLIYLYAIVKNGGPLFSDPVAGGILYMPAKSKFNNDSLAMNGLILDDESVISAMEKDNAGRFIPKYKSGSSSFIDKELFSLIFDNIEKLIKTMGNSIRAGDFEPKPVDGVKSNACMYCDYASVCRRKDSKHIKVRKMSNSEIKERLSGGRSDEI